MMPKQILPMAASLAMAAAPAIAQNAAVVPPFWVRPGYELTVAVNDLPTARMLEFDDRGTLYVSNPGGEIITLRDEDADGFYETRGSLVRNMQSVHGMHWSNGWLWFTTSGAIWKAKDENGDGAHEELIRVTPEGSLPQGGGHWWRSILVTRTHFYTSIGDTGNINDETETDRQKIWRFALDGSDKTLFASGIRNTEKLRVRPGTEEIWGVDHGSDNFGFRLGERPGRMQPVTDYNPPDEFNLYVEGGFYGHPFITGFRMPRFEFRDRKDIIELADKTIVPAWAFGAHWAANSFSFIDPAINEKTKAFPQDHNGDAFVACRGSWNRTEKAGYQIARVLFDEITGRPYGLLTIVNTLSPKNEILGRPVDCVQGPDGAIYWSCDEYGTVYRLRWVGEPKETPEKQ